MNVPANRTIQLDQFLKYVGAVATGGEAKRWIQEGDVEVNGKVEVRRRRKLVAGDVVTLATDTYEVAWADPPQTGDSPGDSDA